MSVFLPSTAEKDLAKFALSLQQLAAGRSNAIGSVTLAAGATSTVVSAINCAPSSAVFLFPKTANAAAALAALVSSVQKQVFTANGTYTPSAGMLYCLIEAWGGGGGGGGSASAAATVSSGGGGGGAGGYSSKLVTAAALGASQVVTIGALGAGAAAGNNSGTAGGDTSVGTLCIAKGGSGGGGTAATAVPGGAAGAGGVVGTGDVAGAGQSGQPGFLAATSAASGTGGQGGSSSLGSGGAFAQSTTKQNGNPATGFAAGGGGGQSFNAGGTASGGAGTPGLVTITEFVSQAGVIVSSVGKQTFTLTHANAATVDRTFYYVCLG